MLQVQAAEIHAFKNVTDILRTELVRACTSRCAGLSALVSSGLRGAGPARMTKPRAMRDLSSQARAGNMAALEKKDISSTSDLTHQTGLRVSP